MQAACKGKQEQTSKTVREMKTGTQNGAKEKKTRAGTQNDATARENESGHAK